MRHRHVIPFGAETVEGGTRFALWAPSALDVRLVLDGREVDMPRAEAGWRRVTVPGAGPGSRYSFRVGDTVVPDPASRFQPEDAVGPSEVVDPTAFRWSDEGWRGRPWEEAVIYEAHVGTATPEGTFRAFAERLPDLARLGITAVELMPLNEFQGRRNWGYDGVMPYAPDASYGSPDDLKALVDRAHGLGIMMILDVVYNHFGPIGNYLHSYAADFFTERHTTPWGAGLNVDGRDGRPVRDFFVENAIYWVREFRFDGLRFDAVHAILDDSGRHLIAELAERTREAAPDREIHLVLENEHNDPRWLERGEDGAPALHTAQWNDDIHHCWHVLLTGETESYYSDFADGTVARLARGLAEGFVYQGESSPNLGKPRGASSAHLPPSAFVNFVQNHDQIGNRAAGDRLVGTADPARLALTRAALLLAPNIPMLFMGEEWGSRTPFQFFVDFSTDPDLSRLVREGRKREFASFTSFGSEEDVPDPTAEATFRASTLDWSERERPPHDAILAETARLLEIRRREVVPITRTAWRDATWSAGDDVLDVSWRYEGGTIRLVANLGEAAAARAIGKARVVWLSEAAAVDGESCHLPAWSLAVTVTGRQP